MRNLTFMETLVFRAAIVGSLALVGGAAGAQVPHRAEAAPAIASVPPPWAASNAPPPLVIPRQPQSRTERILIEAGGGVGAGVVLGVGGLYIGFLAGAVAATDSRGRTSAERFLAAGAYGGAVGAALGVPIGVYLVGNNFNGNGGFGWTVLGSLAGGAVTFGLVAIADQAEISAAVPLVAGIVLPVAGAVLGYELSSDADSRGPPRRPAQPTVMPTVTTVAHGAALGLVGTF